MKRICLLGGTGFVGRHLASELVRRGRSIIVLTRRRERHRELLVFPGVELREANVHEDSDLEAVFEGCDAVVNLVGILNETANETFTKVHVELPERVVAVCRAAGVPRLLHMSALPAGPDGPSQFLITKAAGEAAAHAGGGDQVQVTSFRPSVIFGPDDDFFNRFATLLRISPFLFPLAVPGARLAPVHVADVATVFADALGDRSTFGERYDLCGPRSYTLCELVEYTASVLGLRRKIIGLNDSWSRRQARVLEHAPGKPFSLDNYLSLQVDSVTEENGFGHFGLDPGGIEAAVPRYLGQQSRTKRLRRLRSTAGRSSAAR